MTVVILALAVPGLLAIAWLGGRRIQSTPLARSLALARGADTRGIALQTVIIIVVLLAIAGAVAGVLLQRGSEATSQLEDTEVVQSAYTYNSETLCEAAGFTWDATATAAEVTAATTAIGATKVSELKLAANSPICLP